MLYEVGDEVSYVGPSSNSYYGGSLTKYEKDPNCKIVVEKVRISEAYQRDSIRVDVFRGDSKIIAQWIGLVGYFKPSYKYMSKVAENYKI